VVEVTEDEYVSQLLEEIGDARIRLQTSTMSTVMEEFGVEVRIRPDVIRAGYCSVAGNYFNDPPRMVVAESPTSRRVAFTVLHELAHHLIRASYTYAYRFTSLARAPQLEEAVCDRFAAEVLVPTSLVEAVVSEGIPQATELAELYRRSVGSGVVCVRSAAKRLLVPGYVVVAVDNVIHYAVSHRMLLDIEKGSRQVPGSLFTEAAVNGSANGITQLSVRHGVLSAALLGDVARGDDQLFFGVFVEPPLAVDATRDTND
jgi:Zn-dependent peptidase ImmA (M78 family)